MYTCANLPMCVHAYALKTYVGEMLSAVFTSRLELYIQLVQQSK